MGTRSASALDPLQKIEGKFDERTTAEAYGCASSGHNSSEHIFWPTILL
jgi:hypothetical protein